jgi:hypothetical protein
MQDWLTGFTSWLVWLQDYISVELNPVTWMLRGAARLADMLPAGGWSVGDYALSMSAMVDVVVPSLKIIDLFVPVPLFIGAAIFFVTVDTIFLIPRMWRFVRSMFV